MIWKEFRMSCVRTVRLVIVLVFALVAIPTARAQDTPRRITIWWTDWGALQWSQYKGVPDFTGSFEGVYVRDPLAQILIRQREDSLVEEQTLERGLERRIREILSDETRTELEIRTVQDIDPLDVMLYWSGPEDKAVGFTKMYLRVLNRIQDRLAAEGYDLEVRGFCGSNGCYTAAKSIPALADRGENSVSYLVMDDSWALEADMAAAIHRLEQRVTLINTVGDIPAPSGRGASTETVARLKNRFPGILALRIDLAPGGKHGSWLKNHIAAMTKGPFWVEVLQPDGTYTPGRWISGKDLRRHTVYRQPETGEADEEDEDKEEEEDDDDDVGDAGCFPRCPPPLCPPFCPPFFPPDRGGGGGGAEASGPPLCPPYCPPRRDEPPSTPPPSGGDWMGSASPRLVTQGGATRPIWGGDPGGVDFSSLQLNYLTEVSDGQTTRLGYAFRATQAAAGGQPLSLAQAADTGSDAFFVWLALPTHSFWVNLNPTEPDRIIDPELGKTEAGRILLEADLQMKKTVAGLIHPDSAVGQTFWSQIYQYIEEKGLTQLCFSFRQWIVPGKVTVLSTADSLYIVQATLDVKMESEYLNLTGAKVTAGAACPPNVDPELQQYAEARFREMILPELIAAVNQAPEYRDLRNVFHSRIAAEWYRTQHVAGGPALFSGLINRGTAEGWYSATPWSPREVFERYRRSVTEGEFNITRKSTRTEGNTIITTIRTYFYGGVDFTEIPHDSIPAEEVLAQIPDLGSQLFNAVFTSEGYWGDDEAWFGGVYVVNPREGSAGSLPQPTAVPTATTADRLGKGGGSGSTPPPDRSLPTVEASATPALVAAAATPVGTATKSGSGSSGGLPCFGGLLPLAVLVGVGWTYRRRR